MQNFVNFIKENYSYFVYVIEFLLALVGAVIAFVKARRSSKFHDENISLRERYYQEVKNASFYGLLPTMVRAANILYPIHGDGEKRFEYVYQNVLRLLGREDTPVLRSKVFFAVESILNADKLEKISRDTLDVEPKKEFYEKEKVVEIERSEDLRQDGEENESVERSACYVSRRN